MSSVIARMEAWKVFVFLSLSSILMFFLIPYGGIGFVVFYLTFMYWPYSISSEIPKLEGKPQRKQKFAYILGCLLSVLYILVPQAKVVLGDTMFYILGSLVGISLLVCMFAGIYIASQYIKRAEQSNVPKRDPFILIWLWPIGVWSVQPRLQKVFSKKCLTNGST